MKRPKRAYSNSPLSQNYDCLPAVKLQNKRESAVQWNVPHAFSMEIRRKSTIMHHIKKAIERIIGSEDIRQEEKPTFNRNKKTR